MTDAERIHQILIERDIAAFIASDWDDASLDFDPDAFTGYSGEDGVVRLRYPSLEHYRDSWLSQAAEFTTNDPVVLSQQLHAAQRIERLEIIDDRALATKVFDGEVDGPAGTRRCLQWTSYYFLRFEASSRRWLISGFVGYLPNDWSAE